MVLSFRCEGKINLSEIEQIKSSVDQEVLAEELILDLQSQIL